MEFAVVNNYMGPIATKMMKGYSEENLMQMQPIDGNVCTSNVRKKVFFVFLFYFKFLHYFEILNYFHKIFFCLKI